MVGFIFIYFIGKYFAELADGFKKNKWSWALFGIAFFYASQFFLGLAIGTYSRYHQGALELDELALSLAGAIVALCLTSLLYLALASMWHNASFKHRETLD